MKNSKLRRVLMLAVCAVMLVCLSVGATLAYLTSQDSVTNTFTVGKVAITLDETDVDVYGVKDGENRVKANTYKLIPGHSYIKDPTIHVAADSENCWLFVKVENGISGIEADTTIAAQLTANGWTAIAEGSNVYYHAIVESSKSVTDVPVFETFKIAGDADVAQYEGETVTITAYAVQADGFATAAAAWDATFGASTTVTE